MAGRPPFDGDNPLGIAVQHVHNEPPALNELRPDLTSGLVKLVSTMLCKNPKDRFQSAAELTESVARELDSSDVVPLSGMDLTVPDSTRLPTATSIAARELSRIMEIDRQSQSAKKSLTKRYVLLALILAVAFGAGGLLARWRNTESVKAMILQADESTALHQIPKKESILHQFYFAADENTAAAWKAVWHHYPPSSNSQNRKYALRAKQHLARYFMARDQWDKALAVLDELANVDSLEYSEFQTFGKAGQAIVYEMQGKFDQVARCLASVFPDKHLLDEQMQSELAALARRVRRGRSTRSNDSQ